MIITGDPKEVAGAYVKARSEIQTLLVKDGKANRSTYPTLANILKTITPTLISHGLVLLQETTSNEFGVGVSTSILHLSGASIDFAPLTMQPADLKPQTVGSTISYARRYSLISALGLVGGDEDDDGEKGTFGSKVTPQNSYQDDDTLWEPTSNAPKQPDTLSPAQLSRIHILGKQVYGDDWKVQGPKMVSDVSTGAITSSKELTRDEASTLIRDLEVKLKEKQPHANGVAA